MEFFVAREFGRLGSSAFHGRFERFLTPEMLDFLEVEKLPEELQLLLGFIDVLSAIEKHPGIYSVDSSESGDAEIIRDLVCTSWPSYDVPHVRRALSVIIRNTKQRWDAAGPKIAHTAYTEAVNLKNEINDVLTDVYLYIKWVSCEYPAYYDRA